MSKKAQDYGAINLSQGFPDFDCPEKLKDLVAYYLYDRKNQYPPMTGIPELRQQIAIKVADYYDFEADPELEVTVTSGATEALFNAVQATVRSGDDVIVFDPAYDSYEPAIQLAGANAIHIPLRIPDYSIDWALVENSITKNTKLIIINSPHNPCGSIFELREKCFAVFSFGKTFHATGWKLAYCVARKNLSEEFRKVHQFVTFTTSSFVQYGIADFMVQCPEYAQELPAFYEKKRDTFCELLQPSRFKFTSSKGTYFQIVDYSDISDLPDIEFANHLAQQVGVAAIPLTPFYQTAPDTKILRFCFCKDDETLERAAEILCKL